MASELLQASDPFLPAPDFHRPSKTNLLPLLKGTPPGITGLHPCLLHPKRDPQRVNLSSPLSFAPQPTHKLQGRR